MNNTFLLKCFRKNIELSIVEGGNVEDTLMREFGWLLKPIMGQTKSFEKALGELPVG